MHGTEQRLRFRSRMRKRQCVTELLPLAQRRIGKSRPIAGEEIPVQRMAFFGAFTLGVETGSESIQPLEQEQQSIRRRADKRLIIQGVKGVVRKRQAGAAHPSLPFQCGPARHRRRYRAQRLRDLSARPVVFNLCFLDAISAMPIRRRN